MKLSDEELMVMFAAGTTEAFDMLYDRYKHRIYALALASLRSAPDAEEVVQDVFLRLARAGKNYSPQNKFRAWLFTIATNRIRSAGARIQGTRNQILLDPNVALDTEMTVDESPSASRVLDAREQLKLALDCLSSDQRLILLLREVEGMDISAIAQTMELSQENVRVRIHRARKKLRDRFSSTLKGGQS